MNTSISKTENAVVTRGLTKCYGGRPVVHGLDLAIPTGSVYGLLGRNGAGKSTAIRMLTGMVQPADWKTRGYARVQQQLIRLRSPGLFQPSDRAAGLAQP